MCECVCVCYLELFLFSLSSLEFLLHLLDDTQGCIQVGRRRGDLARLFTVGATESPAQTATQTIVHACEASEIQGLLSQSYISFRYVALGFWNWAASFPPTAAPGWKKLILRYV